MKSFSATGEWWIPGNARRKIHGTLRFEPDDGSTLNAVGRLTDSDFLVSAYEDIPIILGVADGKPITLCESHESRVAQQSMGKPASAYRSKVVLVGDHIETVKAARFDRAAVSYSDLADWTQRSGFNVSYDRDDGLQMHIRYKHPEPLVCSLPNGTKVEFRSGYSTDGDWATSFNIHPLSFVAVTPSAPVTMEDCLGKMCSPLQTFLTLGAGRAQSITALHVHRAGSKESNAGQFPIDVFFAKHEPGGQRSGRAGHMLFTRKELDSALESCLSKWWQVADTLRPVCSLYFATLFAPMMYVDHQFLNAVQAIETYHRRVHGGRYLDPETFDGVYQALRLAIPATGNAAFEGALNDRLKYHNEFSLRKRLADLLERHAHLAEPVLPGPTSFVSSVVDTRNYLTHFDEDLKQKARTDGGDLLDMSQRLKVLLQTCFLVELGLDEEAIKLMIRRSDEFRYLAEVVDRPA